MKQAKRALAAIVAVQLVTLVGASVAQQAEGVHGVTEEGGPPHTSAGDFLTQPPGTTSCTFSDPGVPQILADNVVVSGPPIQIDEIILWGVYPFGNNPGTDDFHVRFLVDSSGLPGAEVAPQETNVPSSRVDTGVNFSSYDQYIFTLTLVSPVTLNSGTNWVEISNDVTGSGDSFCWMEGLPDPTNGVPGFAFAFEDPGVTWFARRGDMSLELNGVVVPVELESFSIEK